MKHKKFSQEDIERMQAMRNRGASIHSIVIYFGSTTSFVTRNTKNPKPRKKAVYDRAAAAKKGHNNAKASSDSELEHQVRVLSSVPSGFKAPSRGMGW